MELRHNSHRTIAQTGTFDLENYGDLLYPIIFRHQLRQHTTTLPLSYYSPLAIEAPQEAGFETQSLMTLFESSAEPRTIVIGGGDILRTDWEVVASHYHTNSHDSFGQLRRSIGTLNAANYLLRKRIIRVKPVGFFAEQFRARWMDYPGAGPFMIDTNALPPKSTISYVSCGVPQEFSPLERNDVKRVLDQARFIYLRDKQSVEKIRSAGVKRELHVAPDLAITLSDQFDRQELIRRGYETLSRFGIDKGQSFLCFQSQPYPGFDDDEIVRQCRHYQERKNSPVVLLPIGYTHRDNEYLKNLALRSGGTLKYADVYSIMDIMAIIASSNVFVGTSLHGNITASSFGIPHVFGPLPVDKAAGYLSIVNLPAELRLDSWNEMNYKIDLALELGPQFFSDRAREAKEKVYRVMDELFQVLLN